MLNEKEIELINYMDYQVLNNGIEGWLGNRAYERVPELIEILNKRNSSLDQRVSLIFMKATISGLGYYQNKDSVFIPEIKEMVDEYEKEIQECGEKYQKTAKDFMNSYGLEDYLTTITKNIRS